MPWRDLAKDMRLNLVILIDKTDGGLRPTTIFRSLYRLHSRARTEKIKDWVSQLKHPAINMAKGRSVSDAIWRQQIKDDKALIRGSNKHSVARAWDVRKAFENVDRAKLWEAGIKHKFPLGPLRLAIAAYSWYRRLTVGDLVSRVLCPARGIGAGSACSLCICLT